MPAGTAFRGRAVGGGPVDAVEARRALALLADPAAGCELYRVPGYRSFTLPGADLDGLVGWVGRYGGGSATYVTVNPVPPEPLGHPPHVGDVLHRRRLVVDIDRPGDARDAGMATEAEREAVREVACRILDYLSGKDWPAPLLIDTGNGFHLVYGVDLPNDVRSRAMSRALVSEFLKRLGEAFDTPGAAVERGMVAANARTRVPGTWNRKHDSTPDRPHRQVRIVHAPGELEPIPPDLLRAEAGLREEPSPRPSANGTTAFRGHAPYSGRAAAWLKSAVDGECGRILLAPPAKHNAAINTAAFKLGQLVGGGVLSEAEAVARLTEAATPRAPEAEARSSIRSGLEAGKLQPRGVPEGSRPALAVADPLPPPPPEGEPLTVCLAAVAPLAVDWLVHHRIPRRFVTVFAGRTGLGKSFVALDLIARLTRGGDIPCGPDGELFAPGSALLISEDPAEYVLVPRLLEAGADVGRVRAMTWRAMQSFRLGDTALLERACAEVEGGPAVVMIDPPTNFLGEADEHRNAEVRQLVMRVVEWLTRRDLACLFILHVNKQTGKGIEALNRVMGSVAWVTTARIAHSFSKDPDDRSRCLWVPMKNNLGPLARGVAYRIEAQPGGMGRVVWLGEVDTTADEAMAGERGKPRRVIASEWLVERFREKREWPSDELFRAAAQEGVSRDAIFEAKARLDLPRARLHIAQDGSRSYCWWVPEDWPPLTLGQADPPPY
jgi:hypothetical protein